MAGYAEYERVREKARDLVQLDRRTPGLRLDGITRAAALAAQRWPCPPRLVGWDWLRIVKRKAGGDLDLAIWHEETLCGLAYGRARQGWLELGYLEANPYPHPFKGKVADVAIAVLQAQALALGLPETRLRNPLDELRGHYARRGYTTLENDGVTVYLRRT